MTKKIENASSEEIYTTEQKSNNLMKAEAVFGDNKKKEKPKKEKKVYQRTTFKHKLKVLGVLALLGVFTGSGLGLWFFNQTRSTVDYNIAPETVMGNVDTVFASQRLQGIAKEKGWDAKAKASGIKPSDFSAVDNVLLCEYNVQHATSYSMIGTGAVFCMGTSQSVYSAKKFDGNGYTFESLSKGVLTVATCDYMTTSPNSQVTTYQGTNLTDTGATWGSPTSASQADFKAMVGVLPNSVSPYIISDQTVEEASEVVYNEETDTYSFTLKLKTVESVLLYYKQVKRSGGLEANPEFHSIEITFTINSNWEFVSSSIVESYKAVKFGMPVTCKGTLDTNYIFNEEVTLPV
ncbi:MAG: hypothetical protein IJY90_03725 [Clostridia bacterium]|nr:hypothetical protein [Clostridia bacterium]